MGNFDLGDIMDFGKKAIKAGAPILGSGLLGPAGELLAQVVMTDNGIDGDAPGALQNLQDKLFADNATSLKKYELDHAVRLAEIDREVRVTEARLAATTSHNAVEAVQVGSSDNYTRRARPTRTYVYMAILLLNYGVPVVAALFSVVVAPVALPSWLFGLMGADCGIYTLARTAEKNDVDVIGSVKRIMS